MARSLSMFAAVVLAASLAGCGDKAGGGAGGSSAATGVEGTWKMDISPMVAEARGPMIATLKEQFATIKTQLDTATPEMREQIRTQALAAVPADQKALVEALLQGEKELVAAADKMLAEKLSMVSGTLEVKSGGAFSVLMVMGPETENLVGTWTKTNNGLIATPKTKNGKPAEGKSATPVDFTLRDGKLVGRPEPDAPEITFIRK